MVVEMSVQYGERSFSDRPPPWDGKEIEMTKVQPIDMGGAYDYMVKGRIDVEPFAAAVRDRIRPAYNSEIPGAFFETEEGIRWTADPDESPIPVVYGWARWVPSRNWSEFDKMLLPEKNPFSRGSFGITITNFSGYSVEYGDLFATVLPVRRLLAPSC